MYCGLSRSTTPIKILISNVRAVSLSSLLVDLNRKLNRTDLVRNVIDYLEELMYVQEAKGKIYYNVYIKILQLRKLYVFHELGK